MVIVKEQMVNIGLHLIENGSGMGIRIGRCGGLVVSVLHSGSRGWVRALARSLCCVLGQDTLLSQCLSPSRARLFKRQVKLTSG